MNLNSREKSKELAKLAYKALDDKKAIDIRIIDISEVSPIADYFIIANGNNPNQVASLTDNVDEFLGKAGYECSHKEGAGTNSSWILLDYNDIIVHVFDKENRGFYNLEKIWNDGKEINIEEL